MLLARICYAFNGGRRHNGSSAASGSAAQWTGSCREGVCWNTAGRANDDVVVATCAVAFAMCAVARTNDDVATWPVACATCAVAYPDDDVTVTASTCASVATMLPSVTVYPADVRRRHSARDTPSDQQTGEKVPLVAMRSAEQVASSFARKRQQALAAGVPHHLLTIPASSTEELKRVFGLAAGDPASMGGGFAVRIDKTRSPVGLKGTVCDIICTKNCGARFKYEYSLQGFLLYNFKLEHDHPLHDTRASCMTTAAGRPIPPSFDELGELLAEAGFGAKDIYRALVVKAAREKVELSFKREDVYDRYVRSSSALRVKDACLLIQQLATRKAQTGLEYFVEDDDNGRCDRIFAECAGGRGIWGTARKSYIIQLVLFFDPTWGTNAYGMKLSMFVTVSKEGETKILAYLVHHEEDYEDVYWGLRCFHKVFKHPPITLITDSGAGILKAADTITQKGFVWEGTAHILCIYHIDQNFYEHFHCLLSGKEDKWREVHNMFWRLGKDSDDFVCSEVDIRIAEIRQYISANGSGKSKASALKWLDSVLATRIQKWAACFTWAFFTAGAHASSRAESTNGVVKQWIIKNSSLVQLHAKLSDYTQFKEFKDGCQLQSTLLRQATLHASLPPTLQKCKEHITAYAFSLAVGQLSQVNAYSIEPVPDWDERSDNKRNDPKGTNFFVKRVDGASDIAPVEFTASGKTKSHKCKTDLGFGDTRALHWTSGDDCSCQYPLSYGVLCRHSWAVRMKRHDAVYLPFVPFAELWKERTPEECAVEPLDVEPLEECHACDDDGGEKSACFTSLTTVMRSNGFDFLFVEPDSDFDIRHYDNCFMILKYGSDKQGGWHIGHMTKTLKPDEMNLYFCFSDKKRSLWLCDTKLMGQSLPKSSTSYPKSSWMLLKQAEPQKVEAKGLQNPNSSRGPGRPQSKRRVTPRGGPLTH